MTHAHAVDGQASPLQKRGAWSVWWLCMLTFGIYYVVWYQRINRELVAVTPGAKFDASCTWWSQFIPIYSLIALARTASRVNAAHASVGSPVRVSSFMTWFLSTIWFFSTPRYLQRRLNSLRTTHAALSAASSR